MKTFKGIFKSAFFAVLVLSGGNAAHSQSKANLPSGAKFLGTGTLVDGGPAVHKFILANGLRVLIVPDDRNPVAMLRIILNAGSNREVPGETGLAHFFEHMMFRKTETTAEGHYDRTLAGVGGTGNAGTSTDYVVYYSTFPGPALENMLTVESERFTKLSLVDPYFSTEKGAVISERFMRLENNPFERGREVLRKIIERGTSYQWPIIGTKEDVQNMSISAAKKFYQDFYTPDNAILTLGGPFEVDAALAKVNKAFGGWKGKLTAKKVSLPSDYFTRDAGKTFVCSEAVTEQRFQVSYNSSNTSFQDAVMASVFEQMINDHPEGQVRRRLLKNKLASNFYVYKQSYQLLSQPIVVGFILNKEQKFSEAEKFWQKVVNESLTRPFTERFKNRVLKQMEVSDAEMAARMTSLAENYEWNEYIYKDALVAKKAFNIVEKLGESEFRNWVRANIVNKKPVTVGVVPTGLAESCSSLNPNTATQKNSGDK